MSKINVDVSDPSLYTKVYHKIAKAKVRYVVNFGGAGSSKSYSQHQFELTNLLDADYDILFIRKFGVDIYDSCYALLKSIAGDWGISHLFQWKYGGIKREIVNRVSGKRIIFKGLDDPEKLKSIVGIKRIICEEASQLQWEDHLELARRARGIPDIQVFYLLNPISEDHWIKVKLIDSGNYSDQLCIIKSTYKDNPNLTDQDVIELERLRKIDDNQARIYLDAEWGVEDKSNKFAYSFNKSKHVGSVDYNSDEFLYLSFDFNVDPIVVACIQHYNNTIYIPLVISLNTSDIYKLCDRIKVYFPGAILIITGDATGRNTQAMVKDQQNYYKIIKSELHLNDEQIKVPSVNPKIEENRVLVNAILKGYNVLIDEYEGKKLIFDLTYVEVTPEKKIAKDNRTNKKQQADALDTFRYYLNAFHRNFIKIPEYA